MRRIQKAATAWTTFLCLTFAVLLFPTILDDRGFIPALLFTGLGVAVIVAIYFGVGSFVSAAAAEELRNRQERDSDSRNTTRRR
jgi:amino acid transporter